MSDIKKMNANWTSAQKIATIRALIREKYFAGRTIPHCMLYDGSDGQEVRDFRRGDFAEQSIPAFRANLLAGKELIRPDDWLSFENATSFSGEYLLAGALRHRATGDIESLEECRAGLRALRAIAALSDEEKFGWLCKPFGSKVSHESSPDQNICAVAGMWHFLPFADDEERAWIIRIIPAIAAYWRKINYTIDFGDHEWNLEFDISHMRIFAVINHLAWHLSDEEKYLTEAQRLDARYGEPTGEMVSLFDTFRHIYPDYFDHWRHTQEFAGATLLFVPLSLDILIGLYPEKKTIYLAGWKRALEHGLIGFNCDFCGHYFNTQVRYEQGDFLWRPYPEEGNWPTSAQYDEIRAGAYALGVYHPNVFWQDGAARLPMAYQLYLYHGGEAIPEVSHYADQLLDRLDFQRIHWMLDPAGTQMIPELQFSLQALTSELPCYLAAWAVLEFRDLKQINR